MPAEKEPANVGESCPFILFWEESWQLPRIWWTCWYDMMVDMMAGLANQPPPWEHRRR